MMVLALFGEVFQHGALHTGSVGVLVDTFREIHLELRFTQAHELVTSAINDQESQKRSFKTVLPNTKFIINNFIQKSKS